MEGQEEDEGGSGGRTGGVLVRGTTLLLMVITLLGTPGEANVVGGRDLCDVECPKTWDPVCSTRQVTYVNACFLYKSVMCIGLRDVREAYRGPCSPCVTSGTCPSYSDPVCGWDGHTYLNQCTFQVSSTCRGNALVNFRYRGACAPDPTSLTCRSFRSCHVLFMPICGSDGRTYGNTCELDLINDCRLEVDRVRVVRDGKCITYKDNVNKVLTSPCSDPSLSTDDPECSSVQPVCGADGRDYSSWRKLQEYNDQRMPAFKVDIAYMGRCRPNPYKPDCQPVTVCLDIVKPVCATNGQTYINHCQLFRKNECRQYRHWIHFLHEGSCRLDMGLGKAGPILMKITIILVIVVVFFAVLVPLYYARRSHQLVTSWNTNYTTYSVPSSSGGRYHLVATVGTDMPMVSIIPIGADPVNAPHPSTPLPAAQSVLPAATNQSTSQSTNQSTDQSIEPSIDRSTDQYVDQAVDQPLLLSSTDDATVQLIPSDYNTSMSS